jgi:hypothetical protein
MSSWPARYFPGIFTRRNPVQDAPTESADGLVVNGEVTGTVEGEASDERLILRLQTKDVDCNAGKARL